MSIIEVAPAASVFVAYVLGESSSMSVAAEAAAAAVAAATALVAVTAARVLAAAA
jgi:hypothetical protein